MNEFSFSDLIMLNHLFKKFQLVIASIAMIASTSLPLGVLQIGVWTNMFEQFYEETRSVFLSAEWTFDGDHRCSGCQLVSDLGAKTKESLKSSSLSIENQLSVGAPQPTTMVGCCIAIDIAENRTLLGLE